MLSETTALQALTKTMLPALQKAGFAQQKSTETNTAVFSGEEGVLHLVLADDRVTLEHSDDADGEFTNLSAGLLELSSATDRDLNFWGGVLAENITRKFNKESYKPSAAGKKPPPKSISKSAIKKGDAYYDTLALGNSFTGIYPDLRAEFKDNYEHYGEFLADEFFCKCGTAAVLQSLQQNDKVQLKRVFNLFNDVYENGMNEAQSTVCVTILGSFSAVQLADCLDYLSDDLRPVAVQVNKYLCSSAGKNACKRLEHPPIYRPKKEKKPGMLQQLMSGQVPGQQPK
ncbi:MAG: hypothetical protein FWE40_01475 [Oscillospiraceae bacterium]|nr:hypothetical protein [Oscillospiraceae bacterium]